MTALAALQTGSVLQSSGGGLPSWEIIAIVVLAGILVLGGIWYFFLRQTPD